ncbi:MAG: universal stress protein [Gaiellaceae bacterium]|jgi:nucleotide-binding universal stress UspA family protein
MNRILIATDGSPGAGVALEQGFQLAADVGAKATVVYARQAPTSFLGAPYYQEVITEAAQHARGVIVDAKLYATRHNIDVAYEVIEGDPVESILRVAKSRDVDLIVVGSRGLGAVRGLVLGSVSNAILHQADRPVLVAKAPVRAAVAA